LPALLKSRDPFCTIPPSRNRHTNIDMKFKTHFASTSYRIHNTHTHRQYSLFNYISISLKKTFLSSFALIQHNMTIYCNVVTICFLPSHHTGEHMVYGPFHFKHPICCHFSSSHTIYIWEIKKSTLSIYLKCNWIKAFWQG
jgi:hypothetical protein